MAGKPFEKNDPRINRKGRLPGDFNPSDAIKAFAVTIDPLTRKQQAQVVIEKAFELARDGDTAARQWIFDRGWGKALERVETNKADGPFFIIQRAENTTNEKACSNAETKPMP